MNGKRSAITRRGFLAASATGLVSAGLAGLTPVETLGQATSAAAATASGSVLYRTLGRTGIKLPVVSYGAANCNDPGVMQAAFALGMRHFDTASSYQSGANEQLIGTVLKQMGVRDQAVIGTKILTPVQRRGLTAENVRKRLEMQVDGSLRRLRSDYIDIMYVHDVREPETPLDPILMEGMRHLRETGKVRAIGLASHSRMAEILDAARQAGVWDVALIGYNFTMANDVALHRAIAEAAKAGIGLIAMKTMAGGTNWPNPSTRQQFSNDVITRAILKWILRNEHITTIVPGGTNHEHLRLDFSIATDLSLSAAEERFLSDNRISLGMEFCRQCRTCLASCPHGVDIPDLMLTHMYAAQHANFALARDTLESNP